MEEAVIREASSADAHGIARVHIASWRVAYADLIAPEKMSRLSLDQREERWRQILSKADTSGLRAWVAMADDDTVGFAVTQPSHEDDVEAEVHELSALYLAPAAWRRGIGTALLRTAEAALREAGVVRALLWVLEANAPARSFYERHLWKADKRDPSFRDFGAAARRYRKDL